MHDKFAVAIRYWLKLHEDGGLQYCLLGLKVAVLKVYYGNTVYVPLSDEKNVQVSCLNNHFRYMSILHVSDIIYMANIISEMFAWCIFRICSKKKEKLVRSFYSPDQIAVISDGNLRVIVLLKIRRICNQWCSENSEGVPINSYRFF